MNEFSKVGIFYAAGAYILWGVLPIYWKLLDKVSAFEILASRFVWSCVFVALLILFTGKAKQFIADTKLVFSDYKRALALLCAAITISFNWGIFIWAVTAGRIVETSMGYYINPLVSVLFGVAFLHERLDRLQIYAVICAAIGVFMMIWNLGILPWISVSLAFTFALYGLIKKYLPIAAISSIMWETIIISPIALYYEHGLFAQGLSSYTQVDTLHLCLLVGAGAVTATPLILFTAGAKLLPLKIVGFLQYFAPTISLFIGIFMYGEPFTASHLLSFGWIWFGLFLFIISQLRVK